MKIKKSVWIILSIILICGICLLLWFFVFQNKEEQKNINYSQEAIKSMKEQNLFNEIAEMEYSKTLEYMLEKNVIQEKYLKDYAAIEFQEKEDFANLVNIFLDKNYSSKEINDILEYVNDKNLNKLKDMEYVDLSDYIKISNMEVDKIDRYKAYQVAKNLDYQNTVTQVNIGLDQEFYTNIITIEDPESITLLLNKFRALPEDWEPSDLVSLSTSSNYKMRKVAADALEELMAAAKLDNLTILPYSPYRAKDRQASLYNNYVARDGKKAADTYSARPRHSEHETGLTVDVRSPELNDNLNPSAYKWVQENGHKYGFIIRYPEGSTPITGYIVEPWHLRYVGVEVATDIHEKNITYDEYYDLYLKDKEAN